MRVIRRLSQALASALFAIALSDTFDWVQSVPTGERLRAPPPATPGESGATAVSLAAEPQPATRLG